MTIWDFSREDTWTQMKQRAADDALDALLEFWPNGWREPRPDMPQDLELWSRQMTLRFMGGTMVMPKWAYRDEETANACYYQIRNAYYEVFYFYLRRYVSDRVNMTGMLPRATMPPDIMAGPHYQRRHEGLVDPSRSDPDTSQPHHSPRH